MARTDRRRIQYQARRRQDPYVVEGHDNHWSQNVRKMKARLSWARVSRRRERHESKRRVQRGED